MGLAHDLLRQAEHLIGYEVPAPSQASLRRAVSTGYYALFHLLLEDAGSHWTGAAETRRAIERAFHHGSMKSVSLQFANTTWKDWHGQKRVIPPDVRRVARAFVELQDEQQSADYDNHRVWTDTEVKNLLAAVGRAFRDWDAIRTDPMAGNYLLAMLLQKLR